MSTLLADGLDNPKGLSFGPDGSLYVAEAGTGGDGACIPSPSGQDSLRYGTSGAVAKIENGTVKRVLTGLPSLAFADGTGAAGPHDIQFDTNGKPYVLMGLAAAPALRDTTLGETDLGKIVTADFSTNSWTSLADIANYELSNNFELSRGEVVSNPLCFYVDGDKFIVVDAGANDLLSVNIDGGDVKIISAIPKQTLTNPIFPYSDSENFDRGHVPPPSAYRDTPPSELVIQSVPTSVVKGPDGAYYVSEFTGFPFPEGGAKIYRIGSDNQLTVYADGFTQLIDLAFDAEGNLYALQHANQSGWKGRLDGSLIKIATDGTRTTLICGNGLESPAALTIGPDGAFYLINRGGCPGIGQVLRIEKTKLMPEPTSAEGLTFGAVGVN
ncbi:MAG: ScyD/ScyE family protein [Stigonema ocellatum SAG 48.90 = DSM 106950]|nr:ScyD/ScyE family protein [Stigonema ocellatum SAG 48.90 = DSM 106950]